MQREGMIHIYTGDGKGKTTAAIGLCVRALGAGLRVFFAQFMKDGTSSEIAFLRQCAPERFHCFCRGSGKFIYGPPAKEEIERAAQTLEALVSALKSGSFDLVFADEIFGALHAKLLTEQDILALTESRTGATELILTGRNAPQALLDRADLVSEIFCRKHYYTKGRPALKGIEF